MSTANLKLLRIDSRRDDLVPQLDALRERLSPRGNVVSEAGRRRTIEVFGSPLSPGEVVQRICDDVRSKGLPALLDYAKRLDNATLTGDTIRVSADELAAAHRAAAPEFLATVRQVRDNVWEFQRAILHRDVETRPRPGVVLRQRYVPLERIGICVPGGAAAYPSTVLMTAVPAAAAGVQQIVVVAPPTP
jgi:histidinol dehydrogenase